MQSKKYTKYFTSCKGVFQGGGCKAIAYIGAYKKAHERGVFFSELAGTFAGSIIAALIAGGAQPEYLEKVVKELDFKSFITGYKGANPFENFFFKRIVLPKSHQQYAKYLSISELFQNYGLFKTDTIENFIDTHLQNLTGLKRSVTFEDLTPICILCVPTWKSTA